MSAELFGRRGFRKTAGRVVIAGSVVLAGSLSGRAVPAAAALIVSTTAARTSQHLSALLGAAWRLSGSAGTT